MIDDSPLPFKPGDWVWDGQRAAQVKAVSRDRDEVVLDLYLYGDSGLRLGRQSPALGGPRSFEPCCSSEHWERITEPRWPISYAWVPDGNGHVVSQKVSGAEKLPPANYVPRKRKGRITIPSDSHYRLALEQIADGHNDARGLAATTLGRTI